MVGMGMVRCAWVVDRSVDRGADAVLISSEFLKVDLERVCDAVSMREKGSSIADEMMELGFLLCNK